MSAAMTFTSLKEQIRNYLERGFTELSDPSVWDAIPGFIGLSQRRLARELKTLGTIESVSSTMTVGVATYAKPDRWRQTQSMRIGTGATYDTTVEVYPRAYEYCRAYWPTQTSTDQPRFYADYNYDHWFIVPTPDEPYPYEVIYNQLPALLSDDTQTNWYTDFAPDALLYGSLMEAQPFLKNPEMMATWQGLFDRALAALNGEDQGGMNGRSINRGQN
jgi:hypothetical protein